MSQHAACSPSSANMWLACPASVTLTKDVPRPSSRFAKEGTAAHAVAEMILKGDIFLPDKITVEGDDFIVSPGMCRALNIYVTVVQALGILPDAKVFLEARLRVPDTDGMVWGTVDCGVHSEGAITVVDLKYGKGVTVDPGSPQLKLYALALAAHVGENRSDCLVMLTICQPRGGGEVLRYHKTTLGALWDWQDFEVRPAIGKIALGDTTENAGAHCRWCVRKTVCGAFAAKHQTHAKAAFDDGGPFDE